MVAGQLHESDGWRFRRLEGGAVEIEPGATTARGNGGPGGVPRLVHVVTPSDWARIVAHVSHLGDEDEVVDLAASLHGGDQG